jgi:aspartate-semialdehyde dehydrogenase
VLSKDSRLIANPNCTTGIAAVVLWPLHQSFRIKKLIISTYQAASGAGAEGMTELLEGTANVLNKEPVVHSVFVHPLPFNLIPHIDKFLVSDTMVLL